jgi:hypothetical protein
MNGCCKLIYAQCELEGDLPVLGLRNVHMRAAQSAHVRLMRLKRICTFDLISVCNGVATGSAACLVLGSCY